MLLRASFLLFVLFSFGCTGSTTSPPVQPITDLGAPDYGAPDTTDPPEVIQVCPPGHSFCNESELLTCAPDGSGYTTIICPDQCDKGECIDQCTAGTSTCKTTQMLETCDANGNLTVQFCEDGCAAGQCTEVQVCTPNDIFCEPGGARLLICDEKGLSATNHEECPYGCDDATSTCKAPVCDPAETRCSADQPNVVEICNATQSGWTQATTPCKDKCSEGECVVLACEADETQCGPLGVEKCNADLTGFDVIEPCKIGCIIDVKDEPQCALCTVGDVKCDFQTIKTCDDALEGWSTMKTCDAIQSCAEGACVDTVTLKEQNPKQDNYILLAKAFVDCWNGKTKGACRAISTVGLTYDIEPSDITKWHCDNAEESDYASAEEYSTATDIMGCGTFNLEELDFKTDVIHKDLNGIECIGFYKDWTGDGEIEIKKCDEF